MAAHDEERSEWINGVKNKGFLATYVPGLRPTETSGNGASDPLPAFEEWDDSFNEDAPPLFDEAISRRSIYRV